MTSFTSENGLPILRFDTTIEENYLVFQVLLMEKTLWIWASSAIETEKNTTLSGDLGSFTVIMPSHLRSENQDFVVSTSLINISDDDPIGQAVGRHFAKKYSMQCFVSFNCSSEIETFTTNIIQNLEEALEGKV